MAVLRSLNILFKGDTSHFKKASKSFRKELEGIGSSVNAMKTMMGISFAGDVISNMSAMVGKIDEMRTSFRDTQQQAQSLRLELGEFKAITSIFGQFSVDQETAVDLLQEMKLRASDAATGFAAVGEFFTMLNQDVDEFVKMDTSTQFRNIITEIGKLDNQSTQLQMLDEIFGDAGKRLSGLVDMGVVGFDDMLKQLRGITGELDNINNDRMEEFNKQFNLLQTKAETLGTLIFVDVVGAITGATQEANGMFSDTGIGELRSDIQGMIVDVIAWKENMAIGAERVTSWWDKIANEPIVDMDGIEEHLGINKLKEIFNMTGDTNRKSLSEHLFGTEEQQKRYEEAQRSLIRLRLGFDKGLPKNDLEDTTKDEKTSMEDLMQKRQKWLDKVKEKEKEIQAIKEGEREKDVSKKMGSDNMALTFTRAIGLDAIIGAQTNPQLQKLDKSNELLTMIVRNTERMGAYA